MIRSLLDVEIEADALLTPGVFLSFPDLLLRRYLDSVALIGKLAVTVPELELEGQPCQACVGKPDSRPLEPTHEIFAEFLRIESLMDLIDRLPIDMNHPTSMPLEQEAGLFA